MSATWVLILIFLLFPSFHLSAEAFRTTIDGSVEITADRLTGSSTSVGINNAVLINIGSETRFIRGIEIEISAPQAWMAYRGALVMSMYNYMSPSAVPGIVDVEGRLIASDPLPSRLQIIYHIPLREAHGLRTTTNITVPVGVTHADTFPLLFRLQPLLKGYTTELERMRFNVTVRPILSNEGAIKIIPRYPPRLQNRPFTVLINDVVVTNITEQLVLREGEHHLLIRSDDYRNESRRFIVERARVVDLIIELQDPTPLIVFEAPQNASIFLNNTPVPRGRQSVAVEPGVHEVKFQIGDYTVIRTVNVQRGKTYRVALDVDLAIHEMD